MEVVENSSMNRLLREANFFTPQSLARRFEAEGVIAIAVLYAVLTAATFGRVPVYSLAIVPILYARYVLGGHEIMHSPLALKTNFLTRMMPFCQSPLSLGYDQYRDIHIRHHRYLGTELDPDDYLASASLRRATWVALIATERAYFYWIKQKGLNKRLAIESLARAAIFAFFLVANPRVFLIYFAAIRISIWSSEIFFHNILHMNDAVARNVILHQRIPGFFWTTLSWLLGREKVQILLEHDTHHAHQAVAAHMLAAAGEYVANETRQELVGAGLSHPKPPQSATGRRST